MKLLEYHENITNYITCILMYQVFIKPYNDKLTFKNLKDRIIFTTLAVIGITMALVHKILRTIKKHENN